MKVNTITYSAAVNACEKGGRCDLACRMVHKAVAQLMWDSLTYSAAVNACEKGGRCDLAGSMVQ